MGAMVYRHPGVDTVRVASKARHIPRKDLASDRLTLISLRRFESLRHLN